MKSTLIELCRFGNLDIGILRDGDQYLYINNNNPVRSITMPLNHDVLLDDIEALSYHNRENLPTRDEALQRISRVVTDILPGVFVDAEGMDELHQLDIVVNAAELAALPFEALLSADGTPLLVSQSPAVTLTRRVRRAFLNQRLKWPDTPRVLFVWASPNGTLDVPHQRHLDSLQRALNPWIGPSGHDKVLTVIESANLTNISQTILNAKKDNRPFSHIHILAHGAPIDHCHRRRFGIALHDENSPDEIQPVKPEELVEALQHLQHTATIVTLATCESGSQSNTLISEKSIAHQLHVSGIPVVLASQFPLTIEGSNVFVEQFYPALLAGDDVRSALWKTRLELYQNRDKFLFDWLSLVCYAVLPEDYEEVLGQINLKNILTSLKTAQAWSDHLMLGSAQMNDLDEFARVESRLLSAISKLIDYAEQADSAQSNSVIEENFGLLGSAQKRLSELYFYRLKVDAQTSWKEKMLDSLKRSHYWYLRATKRNLSQHWQSVQALSIETVLNGRIKSLGLLHSATLAATIATENSSEYWAWGSLIELYLLGSTVSQGNDLHQAAGAVQQLIQKLTHVGESARKDAIDSTCRQLRRYTEWWTNGNGFFSGHPDLSREASALLFELEK